MGLDYYECLGLTRNADDVAVKKAYRRLALQYHPDVDDSEAARTEFIRACEAYDVLSDPKKKGFYDLHGELGLKDGIPDGKGGMKGGFYMFDEETMPEKVFSRFFGTNNPYEALQDISSAFEVMTTKEPLKQGKRKTYEVHLTLEELFHGCLKKVTHTRKLLDESGVFRVEERELTIEVAPGTQDGTLFVFEKEGNVTPQIIPGPVVYVLKSLPHPRFKRCGAADLQMCAQVPLFHALTGGSIEVETLDSRLVRVPITEILVQSRTIVVKGEGMPKPEGGRGDLVIEADLLFPTTLSDAQKMLLKAALFLPPKLSPAATKAVWNFEVAFKDPVSGWSTACPKQAQTTG